MDPCPLPCGEERFKRWRSTLFTDPEKSDSLDRTEYFRVRGFLAEKLANVTRISAGVDGEIMRDVIRTFQKQRFFQRYQPGQRMLLHILFALVATRPDVGYCQGMNYVVAGLLLGRLPECYTNIKETAAVVDDAANTEEDPYADAQEGADGSTSGSTEPALNIVKAAAGSDTMSEEVMDAAEADVFLFMMEMLHADSKLDMAGMWKERIPKLKLRIYQLDRLLRWTYPQLHAHFTAIELSPEVITAQWFLTLFTYTFPVVPTVLQLWDYIFLTGWEGMFKVALSLLGSLQPKLMALEDFESIVMLMREWKREGKLIIQEPLEVLLARADKFVVNKEVLDRLQESFASEILSIALIRSQVLINERESQDKAQLEANSGKLSPVARSGLSAAFHNHFPALASRSTSSTKGGANSGDETTNSAQNGANGSGNGASLSIADGSGSSNATNGSSENTALASLSSTERRKVLQKQQQQEAEIEEQLQSGAEAPVFWLLRYGSKLPEKVLQELRRIKIELMAMDQQVDVDKQLIQAKIIKACELNRETLDEVTAAEQALHEASQIVEQGRVSLQAALVLARQVALEAVELMEGKASADSADPNSEALSSSIAALAEQVASFGTYHNKGFPRLSGHTTGAAGSHSPSGGSRVGSRMNSRDNSISGGDQRGSGDLNTTSSGGIAAGGAASSAGLRFPAMPWSSARRNAGKTDKRPDDSGESFSTTSSSIAKAERDVVREFVYDADASKSDSQFDEGFVGEGPVLERQRFVGVDKDGQMPSEVMQASECDESRRYGARLQVTDTEGDEVHIELSPQKSPDIPIRGAGQSQSRGVRPSAQGMPPLPSSSASSFSNTAGGTTITSSGGHSGGVLSTFSSTGWSFPVVRAFHNMTGTKSCIAEHNQPGTGAGLGAAKSAARQHSKQMKALERRGQWVQQQIIDIDRALEESRTALEFARRRLEQARVNHEETNLWKNSLCDQLHMLVRDANRGRSQKLMYVAENYNI